MQAIYLASALAYSALSRFLLHAESSLVHSSVSIFSVTSLGSLDRPMCAVCVALPIGEVNALGDMLVNESLMEKEKRK